MKTKKLTLLALLAAIALTIFMIEAQIPSPVPIPGVKLGLANVITLVVLLRYRARDAVAVLLLRILLGSIFTGALVGMIYSLCGGLLCFAGMALLCRFLHRKHIWFISLIGAVLHNIGQMLVAVLIAGKGMIFYLPFLMTAGCIAGAFTGLCAQLVLNRLGRQ